MIIETKYNIGDEVQAIVDNEVQCNQIGGIKAQTDAVMSRQDASGVNIPIRIKYCLWDGNWVDEHKVFPTKEELLKSLQNFANPKLFRIFAY